MEEEGQLEDQENDGKMPTLSLEYRDCKIAARNMAEEGCDCHTMMMMMGLTLHKLPISNSELGHGVIWVRHTGGGVMESRADWLLHTLNFLISVKYVV